MAAQARIRQLSFTEGAKKGIWEKDKGTLMDLKSGSGRTRQIWG
jgi:hypothetical protein